MRTADILPRDLAIALTLLEGDKYQSISPADYISHLKRLEGGNNVDAAGIVFPQAAPLNKYINSVDHRHRKQQDRAMGKEIHTESVAS